MKQIENLMAKQMRQIEKLRAKKCKLLMISLLLMTSLPIMMVRAETIEPSYNYYQAFDDKNDWVDTQGETTTSSGLLFPNVIWNGLARTYHNFNVSYDNIDLVCIPICNKQNSTGYLRFSLFDSLDATGTEVFKLEWSGRNETEGRIRFWHNGSLVYNSGWLDIYKDWNQEFRIIREDSSAKLFIDNIQKWSTNNSLESLILSAAFEFTKFKLYIDMIDICVPGSVQVLDSSFLSQNDSLISSHFKFEVDIPETYKYKLEYRVYHDYWTEWNVVRNEQNNYTVGTNYQVDEDIYNINPLDTMIQVRWSIYSKGGYILIDSYTSDEFQIIYAKIMEKSYLSWEANKCTSHLWFYVNISYTYYLQVQYRIEPEEGVWGDWNLLRWSCDNYSNEGTGIYYVQDTFGFKNGDRMEVNWSIHINYGNKSLDTCSKQIKVTFPSILSSTYIYKKPFGRLFIAYSRMYFNIYTAKTYRFIIYWRWRDRGRIWTPWREFVSFNCYYNVGSSYLIESYLGYFFLNGDVQCRWFIYDASGTYLFSSYP
ncbi:MAG: hypothetical protein ACFFFH_04170 [Candidatus Thorarchaeota archaeon]